MDPRRTSRVIDPKVRKVGFFAPQPDRTQSGPADLPPVPSSLSPVMIPPARHASDNLTRAVGVPVPVSDIRRSEMEYVPVGSYNPGDSVLGTSPVSSSRVGDGKFSEELENWSRSDSRGKLPMSLPSNGFDTMAVRNLSKKEGNFFRILCICVAPIIVYDPNLVGIYLYSCFVFFSSFVVF